MLPRLKFGAFFGPYHFPKVDSNYAIRNNGFGTWLNLQGNWANPEDTRRSYELIAREVVPRFNGDRPTRQRGFDDIALSDHKTGNVTAEGQRLARERFDAQRASRTEEARTLVVRQ